MSPPSWSIITSGREPLRLLLAGQVVAEQDRPGRAALGEHAAHVAGLARPGEAQDHELADLLRERQAVVDPAGDLLRAGRRCRIRPTTVRFVTARAADRDPGDEGERRRDAQRPQPPPPDGAPPLAGPPPPGLP
jgi:hypothetical protein